MCGIAGCVKLDGHGVDRAVLLRMIRTLRHRGPDDEGVWADGGAGLASRRLAVIDLSPRGHQPMSDEAGGVHLAFNGEIYNFQDLRRTLVEQGCRFRSETDTETILHLYRRDGAACVSQLRGMFALAIWDAPRRRLLLARDRLGKKPLFYHLTSKRLVFASELAALLQAGDIPRTPSLPVLNRYLTYGYVPATESAFTGVRKLPPAHCLLLEEGRVRVQPYWALHYTPKRTEPRRELIAQFLALLEQSVRLRLVSDVPLGALLSGGLDSSAVVALMRRVTSGRIRTFSIGFREEAYNELPFAALVAKRFETEHHEMIVEPDAAAELPRMVWHYGEPFADSSALPSFIVSRLARQHVTVALNGDGGDEILLGYERYRAMELASRADALPAAIRRRLARAARHLPIGTAKSSIFRLRRFAEALGDTRPERYARWIGCFRPEEKARVFSDDFVRAAAQEDPLQLLEEAYRRSDAATLAEATSHVDVQTYLPDDLLVKMDIASMAHSLEMRSPLLDHQVVEFAARLPVREKLRGGTSKVLLREVMRGELPPEILARRKMGFGVPIDQWFRGRFADLLQDILLSQSAQGRGYFRPGAVRRLIDEHTAGRQHHHFRLWALLMLELWHRTFIDRPPPAEPTSAL
jgi:asparagine synthase (glutamine-hydrolysing)